MISTFLGVDPKKKIQDKLAASGGLPKEEARKLELQIAVPDDVPDYYGEFPRLVSDLQDRTVKLVFYSDADYELFSRYFTVNTRNEKSVSNLKLLMSLLGAINDGTIKIQGGKFVGFRGGEAQVGDEGGHAVVGHKQRFARG